MADIKTPVEKIDIEVRKFAGGRYTYSVIGSDSGEGGTETKDASGVFGTLVKYIYEFIFG